MNGMLRRNVLVSIISAAVCQVAVAQDVYTPVLEMVMENSTMLRAYGAVRDASVAESRTGLTPDNPEVEAGYLFGNELTGDRRDISIRQNFEFPTVYVQKGRLADTRLETAGYQYRLQRQELLLEAKRLCIELIYNNARLNICSRKLDASAQINDSYRRMAAQGEVNAIELNKAASAYASAKLEYANGEAERQRIIAELKRLCGGKDVTFDADSFPEIKLPADFDGWWAGIRQSHPLIQYMQSTTMESEQEVKLALSSWIPKFSVGYMGEFVPGEPFQGITAGITLPLWENKGKVRAARAAEQAAKASLEDAVTSLENSFRALYSHCVAITQGLSVYDEATQGDDSAELLRKALEQGEISLLTYVQEYDYLYGVLMQRLQAQRELAIAYAELTAVSL